MQGLPEDTSARVFSRRASWFSATGSLSLVYWKFARHTNWCHVGDRPDAEIIFSLMTAPDRFFYCDLDIHQGDAYNFEVTKMD